MTSDNPNAAEELARRGEQVIALGQEMLAEGLRLGAKVTASRQHSDPKSPHYPVVRGQQPETRAQALYTGRRIRDSLFGAELFGEPSWDILLDLFIAQRRGRKLPVTTVCIGSQVPSTTALRYIAVLEECGLIARECDPADNRRILLGLSPLGIERMTNFFEMTDPYRTLGEQKVAKLRLAHGGTSKGAD